MSGILAIGREVLSIFAPNRVPPRSLFWNCVIIAFVISFAILWYLEHKKATSSKPRLNAEFDIFSAASAGEMNKDSIITINATITNTGAPSIVKNIAVEIETNKKRFDGQLLLWPKEGLRLQGENRSFAINSEDDLSKKCLSSPIVTGGAAYGSCFLLFSGLRIENIFKATTIIILKFSDVLGKKYYFKKVMSRERIPPPDIYKLQKK